MKYAKAFWQGIPSDAKAVIAFSLIIVGILVVWAFV